MRRTARAFTLGATLLLGAACSRNAMNLAVANRPADPTLLLSCVRSVAAERGLGEITQTSGTLQAKSPVVAGGQLFVYDPGGGLRDYTPATGRVLTKLDAGAGHWNSPVVAGSRIVLPEGDANDHAREGVLDIWAPGG